MADFHAVLMCHPDVFDNVLLQRGTLEVSLGTYPRCSLLAEQAFPDTPGLSPLIEVSCGFFGSRVIQPIRPENAGKSTMCCLA